MLYSRTHMATVGIKGLKRTKEYMTIRLHHTQITHVLNIER